MSVCDLANDIRVKQSESQRLLDTLLFYQWLEEHGLNWDQIKGIRQIKQLIDFKLVDDTTVVLPWPPFSDDVIYNRSKTEEIE